MSKQGLSEVPEMQLKFAKVIEITIASAILLSSIVYVCIFVAKFLESE